MFITGLGTATPSHCYRQEDCWQALQGADAYARLNQRSQNILKKVLLGDGGIETRCLALDKLSDAFQLTPDVLHKRFATNAPLLATHAAQRALADAHISPHEIDAVIVSTCTGYLCPGLTSYLIEALGLRPTILALDLVGQGCGAALPNWRTAEALLRAGQSEHVLSVCVEVCSAAFSLDNDPGVLISACLFGDGAGAAVLSGCPKPNGRSVRWKTAVSNLLPANRDLLRFEQKNGMLRNILTLRVPELAADCVAGVLQDLLKANSLKREAVTNWILHAGGKNVLSALQRRIGLTAEDLRWSAQVLQKFGNLSSASIYHVLQQALVNQAAPGIWFVAAFGAGFSCHGALLHVD